MRLVTHEGVVRAVGSPVAPTKYELYDPATEVNINYLYSVSPDLDLSRYVNSTDYCHRSRRGSDARWKDTPIITIQSIQVIATNAVPHASFEAAQTVTTLLTVAPLPRKSSAKWRNASLN